MPGETSEGISTEILKGNLTKEMRLIPKTNCSTNQGSATVLGIETKIFMTIKWTTKWDRIRLLGF